MTFYDKWFGKGRLLARARTAELRGDLEEAIDLFGQADAAEDVARMFLLRGDGETDPRTRLQHFTQAAGVAPEGTETNKTARLKRSELLLALAGDAAVSAVARHEVISAAKDLEAIGEPLKAADAFARAGDKEGEARALQAAGDVERLEFLLATEADAQRQSRTRGERLKDIDVMIECGRRREALEALEALIATTPDDAEALRERIAHLRARRLAGPIVSIDALREGADAPSRYRIVLGESVVIGRTEGVLQIPSNAVSRRHLEIAREGGTVIVRDLGSRNGTQLRGINLAGALPVGDGLELKLGKEVPLRITSSRVMAGVEIDVAGEHYHARLGNTESPVKGLRLIAGPDGWVELVTNGARAFSGDVELAGRTTLLVGDAISTARRGEVVLRVVGS